jgi:aspartate ammonia-lyase
VVRGSTDPLDPQYKIEHVSLSQITNIQIPRKVKSTIYDRWIKLLTSYSIAKRSSSLKKNMLNEIIKRKYYQTLKSTTIDDIAYNVFGKFKVNTN